MTEAEIESALGLMEVMSVEYLDDAGDMLTPLHPGSVRGARGKAEHRGPALVAGG
ncbi:hypothetical protein [Streptomyces sp. NPDC127092]|uniref:hypothetical protein n=1 Tax=Streptomyces sp. NPDC127092 TaxID=3347135 RepID=UPI00365A9446